MVDMVSLTWGLSTAAIGRLLQREAELRVPPEQQGSNPPNQSTGEKSKAVETTSPIDTSDRDKVTSQKASRSVQERQMEI